MSDFAGQVREIAEPKVMAALGRAKDAYMAEFGDFVEGIHKDKLADHFQKAGECKLQALLATDKLIAADYAKAAERHMDSIEVLGTGAVIIAKAKTASVLRVTAGIILDTLGDVALSIIKTVAAGLIQGVIKGIMPEGGIAGEAGNFPG